MSTNDAFFTQTNESRKAYRDKQRRERVIHETPLMMLGTWVYVNGHAITDAPLQLLTDVESHATLRIKKLSAMKQSTRVRAHVKWLRRWQVICETELERRRLS